jgi:uroporphyrin-III C-methyltransferase/precorrin-2 dehydrogenase/sirohydrochlorin ferrochelatase
MANFDTDEHSEENGTRPARIEPLATLPVFFKLAGKRVLLAGGSGPALWKAELLAAAGANVDAYAEAFAEGFADHAATPPAGRVRLYQRGWQPADLQDAAIAIGSFENDDDASAFAEAARAAGVPVNIIDRPAYCDFQFGAIVNRSPLVVAISTGGGAPVLGQAIRSLIEGLLPRGLRRWAEIAKVWRSELDHLGATANERRRFWDRFTDLAMENAERVPTGSDLEWLLAVGREAAGVRSWPVTVVTVVGQSAELLTLAAIRALRGADVIFVDDGIPPDVLNFARREALRLRLTHRGGGGEAVTPSFFERVAEDVHAGQRVVMLLKMPGGGEARAELEALVSGLRSAGVPCVAISTSSQIK